MKKDLSSYQVTNISCTCGNHFVSRSTGAPSLHVDVCSECHPFYTGQQKILDTGGRVERFNRRKARARTLAAR